MACSVSLVGQSGRSTKGGGDIIFSELADETTTHSQNYFKILKKTRIV